MSTPSSASSGAWLVLGAATFYLAACGGSASETPPPLEPDFSRLPRATASAGPAAPAHRPEVEELDDDRPAPDTWGSGARRSAPKR